MRSVLQAAPPIRGEPASIPRRYFLGALWALGGALVARALTLAGAIAGAHILTAAAYGALGLVQSTAGVFAVLAGAGLGLTLTKYVAELRTRDIAKARSYFHLALAVVIGTGTLLVVFLSISARFLAAVLLQQPSLEGALRAGALLAFFGALNSVQIGALLGAEQFPRIALANTLRSLGCLAGTVAGSLYWGLLGALVALVVAELLAFLVTQYFVHAMWAKLAHVPGTAPITRADMGALLCFAAPALLSSIATQPAIWLSNALLARQPNGLEALAVFLAADRWRQLLLFLPSSLSANTLPILVNLHEAQAWGSFRRVLKLNSRLNMAAIVLPVAATLLFARPLMLIFGADYGAGGPTLCVLAVSAIFVVINNTLGQGIVGIGLISLRLVLDVALGLVLVACAFLLVPPYQELGLALASLAAYAAVGGLLVVAAARHLFSAVPAETTWESHP